MLLKNVILYTIICYIIHNIQSVTHQFIYTNYQPMYNELQSYHIYSSFEPCEIFIGLSEILLQS